MATKAGARAVRLVLPAGGTETITALRMSTGRIWAVTAVSLGVYVPNDAVVEVGVAQGVPTRDNIVAHLFHGSFPPLGVLSWTGEFPVESDILVYIRGSSTLERPVDLRVWSEQRTE
jgi:hypothetical protein